MSECLDNVKRLFDQEQHDNIARAYDALGEWVSWPRGACACGRDYASVTAAYGDFVNGGWVFAGCSGCGRGVRYVWNQGLQEAFAGIDSAHVRGPVA